MRLTGKHGAVIAAAALATACGASWTSSRPPARTTADILREMQSAVKSATSVRIMALVPSGSRRITFDISFYDISEMSGTFGDGKGKISLLIVEGNAFIKVNAAFLRLAGRPESKCRSVCGKYISILESTLSQFTGSLSMSRFLTNTLGGVKMVLKQSTRSATGSYHGQAVLRYSYGSRTVELAGRGTPYPVFISAPRGHVTFSQWNAVQAPVPPPITELISPDQLKVIRLRQL